MNKFRFTVKLPTLGQREYIRSFMNDVLEDKKPDEGKKWLNNILKKNRK